MSDDILLADFTSGQAINKRRECGHCGKHTLVAKIFTLSEVNELLDKQIKSCVDRARAWSTEPDGFGVTLFEYIGNEVVK